MKRPSAFLVIVCVLCFTSLSCKKEPIDIQLEPNITVLQKRIKAYLLNHGGAFATEDIKLRAPNGNEITGRLDWDKSEVFFDKAGKYFKIPFVFSENKMRLHDAETNQLLAFDLVFRGFGKSNLEGALRTVIFGNVEDSKGNKSYRILKSYRLLNGKEATIWLSDKELGNYTKALPIIETKNLQANNTSRTSAVSCQTYHFSSRWMYCYSSGQGDESSLLPGVTCDFVISYSSMTLCDQTEEQYDDWPAEGGGGGSESENALDVSERLEEIKEKPFILLDVPCAVIKAWLNTAKHVVPTSIINKLKTIENKFTMSPDVGIGGFSAQQISSVQKLNYASSSVINMDYFPVTVTQLPIINGNRATPEQFLDFIRKNINSFVNTDYSEFKPYNWMGINDKPLWNSSNPLGAIIAIDINGPDNGSVVVSGYSSDKWTFTTIYEPLYGLHPVSGNRDFGFNRNPNGSYTFYTRGVDRLTSWDGDIFQKLSGVPFNQADALWESFQSKIRQFVNEHHGSSSIEDKQIHRPKWEKVKAVLNGNAPLSILSNDC